MMLAMHDGIPYGHLAFDGRAIPPEVVARKCGATTEQYAALLAELDAVGVPSRSNGVIFSRRMVRDQRDRDQAAARKRKERAATGPDPPVSRQCHADVTPMSQRSSSSSSSSDEREGDAGAREIAVAEIEIMAAMGKWSSVSRGIGLQPHRNDETHIRLSLASWEQEAPYAGVEWNLAVLRCIKAAQASGTKFGDSPKYAIRVVNSMLAAWRQGTPPEPQASEPGSPRFVADDDGAMERGLAASNARIDKLEAAKKARAAR